MGDEYEEEAAPPAERLQIAEYFIMNSPAGEVDLVIKDAKVLVNATDNVLTDEKTTQILSTYNVERMEWAKSPDTQENVIVSTAGKLSRNSFVDPSTNNVHEFNHLTRKFSPASGKNPPLSAPIEEHRAAIARAARDYIAANFTEGKCVNTTYGSEDGTITCCLSAKNVHLGNFWTGSWRSVYTLNVSSEGKTQMSCSVNIGSHYFEDGNVQMHSDKKSSVTIDVGDKNNTANAVGSLWKSLKLVSKIAWRNST
jgi:capping protein alpha